MTKQDPTANAVLLAIELQAVISEGRMLLKDFTAERKEAQKVVDALSALAAEEAVRARVAELIQNEVREQLGQLSAKIGATIDIAETRVLERFERISALPISDRYKPTAEQQELIEVLGIGIRMAEVAGGLPKPF